MVVVVHYLNDSRAQRILWLLEELQVPYTIKKYERTKRHRAPPELLAINPVGKAPVIQDGDVILAESGAIVEYLVKKYGNGRFVPSSDKGEVINLYYTHYSEGTLAPILTNKWLFDHFPNDTFLLRPFARVLFGILTLKYLLPEVKKNLAMIEKHLGKSNSPWFAGDSEPTSADFQMSFPLEAIVAVAPHLAGPRVTAFVKAIHDREAYKKAFSKGVYKFGPKSR